MHVTLLHNPKAGREKLTGDDLVSLMRGAGYDVTYASTKEDYSGVLTEPGDFIAVAGGDGTVEKVGRRIAGMGIPLAILPMGTANNIANAMGIQGSLHEIVSGWQTARRLPFDVGVAKGPWGERYFLEGVGFGAVPLGIRTFENENDAHDLGAGSVREELHRASLTIKEIIEQHPTYLFDIQLDGRNLSGSYVYVAAMNIRALGPRVEIAPDADPGDGQFHLVLISEQNREAFLASFSPESRKSAASHLTFPRGRHVQITWKGTPLHIDDEVWPEEGDDYVTGDEITVDIRIEHKALEVLVPG